MTRIAITGASGNLGSAVVRRLAEHHLVGISRRVPDPAPFDWYPIDLTDPDAELQLAAAFAGSDAVVHLAWQLQPSTDLDRLRAVNVEGTERVVRAAMAAGVPHLVVASSVGAYSRGPKDRPVDESWRTDGVPSSSYSRQKVAVERFLDTVEGPVITRLRPALIFQAAAGAEIKNLFLGKLVPAGLAGRVHLPVLPLPRDFRFQAVHADDVAAAVAVALEHRPAGGLNVAAEPLLRPDDLARALGAGRSVPAPLFAVRALASATWHARLQPTEPGWIDLAASVPWMSTARLEGLGWRPAHTGPEALAEIVSGIQQRQNNPAYPPLQG